MEWYWIVLIVIGSLVVWFTLSAVFYKQFFKRFYDLTLSLFALIVLSPLLLILTIVGAIAMKGNPFFVQLRPGKIDPKTGKERIFKLIKFRTMSNARDKDGNLLPDEQRLNSWGKIERFLSIDELPELINIGKGDMSFVGPRPLLVKYLPYYTEKEHERHLVRPGLTGNAQVNGRNEIVWEKKFELDTWYVEHISMLTDIKILFMTIATVFSHKGISLNALEDFDEYRKHEVNANK